MTLGVVMGAFLVCWLPFFSWYLTVTICGEKCQCPDVLVAILFWIGKENMNKGRAQKSIKMNKLKNIRTF